MQFSSCGLDLLSLICLCFTVLSVHSQQCWLLLQNYFQVAYSIKIYLRYLLQNPKSHSFSTVAISNRFCKILEYSLENSGFGMTDSNWRVCVAALACINRIIERNMQTDSNVQLIFHRNPSKFPLMKCLSPENVAQGLQEGKNLTKVKSRRK